MNIFITGASGFLGQRLVARLKQDHHTLSALSRSKNTDALFDRLGVKPVSGSLDNIEEWAPALAGQDVVIHTASPVDFWGEWETFQRDIVSASLNLYRACGAQSVKRFIHISTEAVSQDKRPLLDIDETLPYPEEPDSLYGKAKKLAELALLNHASPTELLILRPVYIWGKDDKNGVELLMNAIKSNRFIWIDHGQASIEMAHVENVVEAIRLALTKGQHKGIYFVTDDRAMPVKDFLTALLKTRNVTIPNASLPSAVARPVARFVEGLWRMLRLKSLPPISRAQLDFLALPRRYNLNKIKQELGYKPVYTLERGLKEMESPI